MTAFTTHDSTFVELELKAISLDRNWDRLFGNSTLEGNCFVCRYISAVTDSEGLPIRFITTFFIFCMIGISPFKGYSVVNYIPKSIRHVSAITSFIFIRASSAVNQLLRRESLHAAFGQSMETFKSSTSGESPAWATLALVSDCTYSFASPINFFRRVIEYLNGSFAFICCRFVSLETCIKGSKFMVVEICKLIELKVECFKSLIIPDIVLPNSQKIIEEYSKTVGFLLSQAIGTSSSRYSTACLRIHYSNISYASALSAEMSWWWSEPLLHTPAKANNPIAIVARRSKLDESFAIYYLMYMQYVKNLSHEHIK